MKPLLFVLALVLCPILAVSLMRGRLTEFWPSLGALGTATRRILTPWRHRPEYIREEARQTFFAFWQLVGISIWMAVSSVRDVLGLAWVLVVVTVVFSHLPYSRRARFKSLLMGAVVMSMVMAPALSWLKYRNGLWFVPMLYGVAVFLICFREEIDGILSAAITDLSKGFRQIFNYHD